MAASNGIRVHVYGDYDNKQIDKAIRDLQKLRTQGEEMGSGLAAQGAKFQAFGAATAAMGAKLTKGLTLPIVGVATAAIVAGADFERSMNKVKAISGATGADFDRLKDQAKELGRTTGFSASEAADAMSFLAMAGFKTTEILGAMPGTLNLAAAGSLDLARAADISSNILTGYGLAVGELDHAVDVLAKTFTSSNTNLEQLGEAFKYAGPVAASAGVQFEQAAAAIGLMGNAGIQGSMAGTSLRGAISRLLNPTTQVTSALDRLGITVVDSAGNLLPLDQIVQQLGDSGATTGDYMQIFGQRAGPAMAALVRQGSDALVNLTTDLENSGGTAKKIADTQLEGFHGALIRLKSAFEGLMIAMAESGLLDRVTGLFEGLVNVVARLAQWIDRLPGPVKDMAFVFAALAAAVGPVLWVFGKLVGAIGFVMVKLAVANGAVTGFMVKMRAMAATTTTSAAQVGTGFAAIGASAVASMGIASRAASAGIAAFRGLSLAVKTLWASLGPVGAAIIALGAAYTVLSGRAADADEKVQGLKEAILQTGEAGKAAVLKEIIEDLQELEFGLLWIRNNAAESLGQIGIGVDDAAIALSGGNLEFAQFIRQVKAAAAANGLATDRTAELVNMLNMQRDAFKTATSEAGKSAQAQDLTASAAQKLGINVAGVTGDLGDFAEGLDGVEGEAGEAESAIKKLSDMFSTFDANVAAIRARDAFRQYMRDFSDGLAKNNRDLLENNKFAEQNRDKIVGALESKKAEILKWAEANGKGQEDVDKKWDAWTTKFRGRLEREGFKSKDLEEFFGSKHLDVASVNVQNEMGKSITSMARANEHMARKEFTTIGTAMTDGVKKGISAGEQGVVNRARNLARRAAQAAREELGVQSPSKVFEEIGSNSVEGFIIGINRRAKDAEAAVKAMGAKAIEGLQKAVLARANRKLDKFEGGEEDQFFNLGLSKVKAIVDGIKFGEGKVAQAAKGVMDKAFGLLEGKVDAARTFGQGVASALASGLDLGKAYDAVLERRKKVSDALIELEKHQASMTGQATDAQIAKLGELQAAYDQAVTDAGSNATNIVDEFVAQGERIKHFGNTMNHLLSLGLRREQYEKIMAMGADRGMEIANALNDGNIAQNIARVNDVVSTVQSTANQVGANAAQAYHGQGIALAAEMVIGIVKDLLPAGKKRKQIIQALRGIASGGGAEAGSDFQNLGRSLGSAFGDGASAEITGGKSAETVANGVRTAATNVETVAAGSFRRAGYRSVVAFVSGVQQTLKPGTEEHDAFMVAVTNMVAAIQEPLMNAFKNAALKFATSFIQTMANYVKPATAGFTLLDQAMLAMVQSFTTINQARFGGSGLLMGQTFIQKLIEAMSPGSAPYNQLQAQSSALASSLNRTITYTIVTVGGGVANRMGVNLTFPQGATGGIVNRPTIALIGEAGPEAVIPLNRTPGNDPLPMTRTGSTGGSSNTFTINVNAGIGTDGAAVGQQIVDAIKLFERRSGKVFVAA